jgi:hypothetical protein
MSFKFRQNPAVFRSKSLIPWDISRLGLFPRIVLYVTDKKYVKSIGFVSRFPPFLSLLATPTCTQSSMAAKSAPKERHKVAHGVKPWVGAPCLSPSEGGVRACEPRARALG